MKYRDSSKVRFKHAPPVKPKKKTFLTRVWEKIKKFFK